MRSKVNLLLATVCALAVTTLAVPTVDRIRVLYPENQELIDRISSFGGLVAHDAHRVYRKSFDGFEMNDLDAMLDQLLDGRARLWEQLSRFTETFGIDSDETEGDENLFTELISQLQIDPDSMTEFLSGKDKLVIDGKRMECMMEVLDKLSQRIKDVIEQLEEDQGSWLRRWAMRQLKSAMGAMLDVVESIKTIVQDAEIETAMEEDNESLDESVDDDVMEGELDLENVEDELDGANDEEAIDAEWERIVDNDQGDESEGDGRSKRSVALRRKRATVTSNFFARRGKKSRYGGRYQTFSNIRYRQADDENNQPLRGGWSVGPKGLKWINHKSRNNKF